MGLLDKLTGKKDTQPQTVPARSLLAPGQAPPQPQQPMAPLKPEPQGMPPQLPPQGPQDQPMPPQEAPMQPVPSRQMRESAEQLMPGERVRVVDEKRVFTATPEDAPVFVKLARYEDLLEQLAGMKANSVNVRALLQLLDAIREIEAEALDQLNSQVAEMEASGDEIDEILVKEEPLKKRVQDAKFAERKAEKNEEVQTLEQKVRKLKEDIRAMSK